MATGDVGSGAGAVQVIGGWLLAILVSAFAALALHEAAHALAALATGSRPTGMTVGVGPRLCAGRRFGVDFEVRALPAGGSTRHPMPTGQWSGARHVAFVAAGPLSNLAVAAGCLLAWPAAGGGTGHIGDAVGWIGVVNLLIGAFSLLPLPADGSTPGSDGWQLLAELRGASGARDARTAWELAQQAEARTRAGQHDAAIDLLDGALDLTDAPPPSWRALRASLLLATGDGGRRPFAVSEARAVLGGGPLPSAIRPRLANALAFELVAGEGSTTAAVMAEAEQWARLAVSLDDSPLAQDTLALVLVRQGRFVEAAALVDRATAGTGAAASPATRASMCCTAALAAIGLGDLVRADRLAAQAHLLDPGAVLLPQVRRRLTTS